MDKIDKYFTENLSRVNVPDKFRPYINVVYPPYNELIFEEWFRENYVGCNTTRVYLDIFPTSYWVNNNYGNDAIARKDIQDYVDSLPDDKKYFSICQYDDGFMIDWKGKDVLEFNMSKQNGVMMPLICQPKPYKFTTPKKWFASFVGSRTHPIRNELEKIKDINGYYISFDQHSPETYSRIIHESIFTLCPRGYGANSFRYSEALQYGSIPVYISDEFILPWDEEAEFITLNSVDNISDILEKIEPSDIVTMQDRIQYVYNKYFTYEGNLKLIIDYLES